MAQANRNKRSIPYRELPGRCRTAAHGRSPADRRLLQRTKVAGGSASLSSRRDRTSADSSDPSPAERRAHLPRAGRACSASPHIAGGSAKGHRRRSPVSVAVGSPLTDHSIRGHDASLPTTLRARDCFQRLEHVLCPSAPYAIDWPSSLSPCWPQLSRFSRNRQPPSAPPPTAMPWPRASAPNISTHGRATTPTPGATMPSCRFQKNPTTGTASPST